ncbi:cyclohexa-1,5-dienecarbonyl-CoA hydratase [candidate division KSB1 bacterium]|nr:cyclohexa-1,5-dienecarbonyl-CoA hydratase [candidate division KSB1 bacterium]NIR71696.1 cyclohexa-1,5-dienecarbonyl-CoA hydratase [candidate division KSB1 bacterium]NIS23102.1 cyclohexa-1,5-dienecarbonyl-CoA hydratase [candidate division KSB1 bacterium]NIT69937.1 cyclohexa-1,5-dienecarbonyl-CoA hydratase [candidate division KSB1 bacterium]NIU26437.1 cyclohexa-1,5-dienecarbonyl-CoA hydratase [candidate division KSB1 bacterium]
MNTFNKIKLEHQHDNQILGLTLNAPKGNVLDKEMMTELTEAVSKAGREDSVKALVFRGEGDHFSFGASVPEHQKKLVGEMLATFHELMRTLIETSKPMVAVVRGQCLGGGLELAAFCHWIFAAEDAMFGQPEIKLGVFPPVASLILPYGVGQSAAEDLILSGRSIPASRAKELGLVHSISADPEQELAAFISEHILPKSTAALQFAVKSSRYEMHQAFLRNIDAVEKLYVQDLMTTEDANEGIQAFMEKRKPVWKNR